MEDMIAVGVYMENVRKLVGNVIAAALRYLRLVLVLDGVDHLTYLPLTAAVGPKKLEAYEVAARLERRNSASKGASSNDPFFNVPAPLWFLPHEIPPGFHMVFTVRSDSPTWNAVQERNWGRENIPANGLSLMSSRVLMDSALKRKGTDQAWGHNSGLLFRTLLDDVFIEEAMELTTKLHATPPVLPPTQAQSSLRSSTNTSPVPTEDITALLPTLGEPIRVQRGYFIVGLNETIT